MATSGSVDFNQTRNEIIQDALELIGAYGGEGDTISSADYNNAARQLNRMIKHWQAKGAHIWTTEEAVLFVADNTGTYTLSGDSSSARACNWDDAVITELSTAGSASDTSLTVDSTTGMAANDIIGIVLDDDSVDWTTISSVDSSTTLTIASGLSSAAAINNNIYTFTTRINKPLRIHSLRRRSGVTNGNTSAYEVPLQELSHSDFFELPNQDFNGLSSSWYYNPDLTDGKLYLWPRPNDPEVYFRFTYTRQLEDFDAAGNNPDFPSEWLDALVYQLAVRLAPRYGKEDKLPAIQPIAQSLLRDALKWDSETAYIKLIPDTE